MTPPDASTLAEARLVIGMGLVQRKELPATAEAFLDETMTLTTEEQAAVTAVAYVMQVAYGSDPDSQPTGSKE